MDNKVKIIEIEQTIRDFGRPSVEQCNLMLRLIKGEEPSIPESKFHLEYEPFWY